MPFTLDPWWEETDLRPASNRNATFHQFAQLPPEIRCKIWQASWTPREFKAFPSGVARVYTYLNNYIQRLDTPLPVTAAVNQESRHETLRKYRNIPLSPAHYPHMAWPCDRRDVINYEIDTVSFTCCGWQAVPVKSFSATLIQKLERIHVQLPCAMAYYMVDRYHRGGVGYSSFDNFLRYVVAAHFPNLHELTVDLVAGLDRNSFRVVNAFRRRQPFSFFLRTEDGGGVYISPSSHGYKSSLSYVGPNKIRILFMNEKRLLGSAGTALVWTHRNIETSWIAWASISGTRSPWITS
ncbi:hypothetical protein PG993_008751 [Apiospora rasikravindrae]|uniref:2EXR domain-containing protein n=1 Tax=Apiospora rasikravindrae TaxID=990691 RepID=A0ABR1SP89_9PEZI